MTGGTFDDVLEALSDLGLVKPSKSLLNQLSKMLLGAGDSHRCLGCPYHAETQRGLKNHLRKEGKYCLYGQKKLKLDKKKYQCDRMNTRLDRGKRAQPGGNGNGDEGVQECASEYKDLYTLSILDDTLLDRAEKDTLNATIYAEMFLVSLGQSYR